MARGGPYGRPGGGDPGGGSDDSGGDEPDGPGGGVDLGGIGGGGGGGGGDSDDSGGGSGGGDDFGDPFDGGGGGGGRDFGGGDDGGDGGGGGGSPGGSSPPPSDVGGPGGGDDTDAPQDTNGADEPMSGASGDSSGLVDRARGVAGRAGDAVQDVREFQRETTPVQDAGTAVRQGLGLPSEAGLAAGANERIADAVGTSPREARLDVREGVIDTTGDAAATVTETVPGGRDTLAGAATVGALAEPTPIGEALVFGGAAAAGATGSTLSDPEQGEELVPESPFADGEIDTPDQPADDSGELGVGEGRATDELPVPTDGRGGEIEVPTGETDPLDQLNTLGGAVGQQRERDRERRDEETPVIDPEDIIEDPREPEQDPPSTRERQRRDDLDVFERGFPTGEGAVIGRETGVREPEVDAGERTVDTGDAGETATETQPIGDVVGVGRGAGDTTLPDVLTTPEPDTDTVPETAPDVVPQTVPVNLPEFDRPTTDPTESPPETQPTDVFDPATPGATTPTGDGSTPRRVRLGLDPAADTDRDDADIVLNSAVFETGVAQDIDEFFDRIERF